MKMGQRHQYVVVYPEMYLNEGNCNNKPMRAEVIHHQWLYGRNAILALERVLTLVATSWDGMGTDYLFGRYDRGYTGGDGTSAIAAAISVDPSEGYYHNVHVCEKEWYGKESEEDWALPADLDPDSFDNNDGITLIQFEEGEKLPKVCFVTPRHLEGSHWKDSHGRGPWTAEQYLRFYYSPEEQTEWDRDVQARMELALSRIGELSRPMRNAEVKTLLPKFSFRERVRAVS